jgi:glucan biosynthesis protein C
MEDWHLKAPIAQQSDLLSLLRGTFVWFWLMELFFLVAGFASWYALKSRTGGQYLGERVKRLLIPLYTVGLFILMVPQAYFERFTHGLISGTFWQWLPGYFSGLPGEIFTFGNLQDPIELLPYGFAGNLWFIEMLFLIVLVALPVFLYLKSAPGQRLMAVLAGWSTKAGGIFLFVIPLAVGRIALNWLPVTTDRTWGTFVWYALYFIFGFMIAADNRFTESIKKHLWLYVALWLLPSLVVGGLLKFVLNFNYDSGHGFSLLYVIWQITYSLASWSSVIFMLSLGARYLNFNHKYLPYCNEAVLPFFMFHQTIILIVGWFVLPLQIDALPKYLIIATISFPVILLLYEAFVRRFNFMRFLFGMAPKKQPISVSGRVVATTK